MKRRCIAVLLFFCLFIPGVSAPVLAQALEQNLYPDEIREPSVETDDSLSTGQVTEWSCITFGSYPQTEIVGEPSTAVDGYAVQEGDFLEDPNLYKKLTQAEWNDDQTRIGDVRYLRMNREDAVSSASDREGHYRWGEGDEWHYFRFDPIRWRVIGLDNGAVCLMADKLLDCQPYNFNDGPVTWEGSTVRSWLNSYSAQENDAGIDYRGKGFLDMAFSAAQQEAIIKSQVENRPNGHYDTDCGKDTEDCVFLLSNDEVFSSDIAARNGFYAASGHDDPAKRFRSTMYAKCRGAWWSSVNGYMGNSFWFMRTNGYNQESVTYICDFGYIYRRGTITTCEDAGLLPALWIDLDRAEYETAGTVSSKDILKGASRDAAAEDPRRKDQIINPTVTLNEEKPDGKEVTYSLVSFGSYPQSEIVAESGAGSENSIVDAALYDKLEKADWKSNELELDGKRYLRLSSNEENDIECTRYFVFEPLIWRALEVRDGTVLLLSNSAVECEPFQRDLQDVSWENCTLRSWLNGYDASANASAIDYSGNGESFLEIAFSDKEQEAILETAVRNEANYYFGMDSGEKTNDRIFPLAESEIFIYDSAQIHGFSRRDEVADRAKQFQPTDYAIRKGIWYEQDGSRNVFWITRTTGYTHANVVYVDESGYMFNRGILVTCKDAAIIPALVLDLDSTVYEYAGTCTIN